jgi:hypothetical protein
MPQPDAMFVTPLRRLIAATAVCLTLAVPALALTSAAHAWSPSCDNALTVMFDMSRPADARHAAAMFYLRFC